MTWGSLAAWLIFGALLLCPQVSALGSCNETCSSNSDCSDRLVCSNKMCTDDPTAGTNLCGGGTNVASSCNQVCTLDTDCPGELDCLNNKCTDDPFEPTHICGPNNGCKLACKTLDDCPGKLICINKECTDDPRFGTHICGAGSDGNSTSGGIAPAGIGDCNTTTLACPSSMASSSPGALSVFEHIGIALCVFVLIW